MDVSRLVAGDQRALARAISAVENGDVAAGAILAALPDRAERAAAVVGFTGPPGAGKSTLVGAYAKWLCGNGRRVAVLAVDPSSPHGGGALLGDRLRMPSVNTADGLFIRSLSARGHLGGLSAAAPLVIELIEAAGYQDVLIETVGAGQSEIEVASLAAVTVVVCAPGLGDQVQSLKAGLLDVADLIVVNKGDSPLAAAAARDLEVAAKGRGGRSAVPLLTTVATTGAGIDALARTIAERLAAAEPSRASPDRRLRHMLANLAAEAVYTAALSAANDSQVDAICAAVRTGKLTIDAAVQALIAAAQSRGLSV
jgi:LAO/AO transport system ATPase